MASISNLSSRSAILKIRYTSQDLEELVRNLMRTTKLIFNHKSVAVSKKMLGALLAQVKAFHFVHESIAQSSNIHNTSFIIAFWVTVNVKKRYPNKLKQELMLRLIAIS
ncbi:hypothetical protein D3C76_1568010 [compost metagenome]